MHKFKIGDRLIGPGEPTFVIDEAGSNYNGDLSTARGLIEDAVDTGTDVVKLQTF